MSEFNEEVLKRLDKLERAVFGGAGGELKSATTKSKKQVLLPELARNKLLKNGQKKITVIVGYNEKILNNEPLSMSTIREYWKKGKFMGKYDPKLLERALTEGLIREPEDNAYDLGQKGEDFFGQIVNGGPENG